MRRMACCPQPAGPVQGLHDMKTTISPWLLVFLLCAANAHAQLYKWVGPDGKVNYSDTPPPPLARQVETKSIVSGGDTSPDLPYELAEAVKGNPVTLYTTANCPVCDEGRQLLHHRGIPFSEKTVTTSSDVEKLRQAGGNTQLPFLTVGHQHQQGFEPGLWQGLLSAAGYPESNRLPKGYRNSPPQSAAPASVVASEKRQPSKENGQPPVAPANNIPLPAVDKRSSGFRF